MPKLKINDNEIEVAPGTSVLQAAEMLGYEVPRFCYHDKLSVPANCRMCLVEVKGAPKPVASCAMACGENMEVLTDSAMVKKARNGVMEMLLINHPLDCPICDQGGECDLQDQAMGYGYDRSRYHESKRAVKDKYFGPLIKTEMNRCIQCTRCVRFADEIAGVSDIGLLNRGEDAEISNFIEKAIGSELSGNLIDVCPVGALTSKPYAYKARPWELRKVETIDVHDAVGSNIRVDARGNEVLRILPRLHEGVNEEWISDKTRFAYDGLVRQRLDQPYFRENGRLRPASWEEAFALAASKMKSGFTALTGDLCAIEEMTALKDLAKAFGGKISGLIDGLNIDTSSRAGYLFNSTIAGIEQADAILLIGTNPRKEAAMVNARIRKAWLEKRVKIAVIGENADLSYPAQYLGSGLDVLQDLASGKNTFADILKNAQNPMIIIGAGALSNASGKAIQILARELAEKFNVIKDDWNGFNVLHLHAAQVGALDLCLTDDIRLDEAQTIYLLGVDGEAVDTIPQKAFVIYQGHHGDKGASRADIILPGAAYTEKDGLYVNMEGRVQLAKKVVTAPGNAKEDWKIIRALSAELGQALPYDSAYQLRQRLFAEFSHLAQVDSIQHSGMSAYQEKGDFVFENLSSKVENFYMTNVITRASETMAKCTEVFLRRNDMAEAAE